MLRVPSPLDDHTEALITGIIGACITVHRELGPGLLERIYHRAVAIELEASGVAFEVERQIPVTYRGQLLCYQRLDIVVANKVLVEIKGRPDCAAASCAGSLLPACFAASRGPAGELQLGGAPRGP